MAEIHMLSTWPWLALTLTGLYVVRFVLKFIQHRRSFIGLPTPEHSMLLGNLKVMGDGMKRFPADFHPQPLFTVLSRQFRGLYYMDLYPFSPSFLIITDPILAMQVQDSPKFERHDFVKTFLRGIIGTKSLFATKGAEWKRQHSWFAPAFSMTHLLKLVPGIVEETMVFREKLVGFSASGEVFPMTPHCVRLTIDVIARSVGNFRLKSQTSYSPIQHHFSEAISWTAGHTSPFWQKVASPAMMKYHIDKLDKYLEEEIKDKFRKSSEDGVDKTILDLAYKGYTKDSGKMGSGEKAAATLDPEFLKIATENAKVFLAGGHDTTSTILTYMFYYLSISPDILSRVRAEHTEVFGATLQDTIDNLRVEPARINRLPLTLAILKEVLRLHPVGFTIRQGVPGSTLNFEGRDYPVNGTTVVVLSMAMQRNKAIWGDNAEVFEPDRFLDPERPVPESWWQPFERGPRACIGRQLSLLEAQIIAVLILRYFEFEAIFKDDSPSIPGFGGRAYQALELSAKPKDGLPMRVKMVQ